MRESVNSKVNMDSSNQLVYSNELWFLKPDYIENSKRLKFSQKTQNPKDKEFDYKNHKKAPTLCMELIKLKPEGKPPAPRCLHAAVCFGK